MNYPLQLMFLITAVNIKISEKHQQGEDRIRFKRYPKIKNFFYCKNIVHPKVTNNY
jgi:hypothetical protein